MYVEVVDPISSSKIPSDHPIENEYVEVVDNDQLPADFRVLAAPGKLLVTVPHLTRMYLFDASGKIVCTRDMSAGDTRIEGLESGNYILIIEGKLAQKIFIP